MSPRSPTASGSSAQPATQSRRPGRRNRSAASRESAAEKNLLLENELDRTVGLLDAWIAWAQHLEAVNERLKLRLRNARISIEFFETLADNWEAIAKFRE